MDPQGSLPCSKEPTTGPYPGPDESNPISLRSVLILYSHLTLAFQAFQPKFYTPHPAHPA
jgi:hypothetical protein